MFLSNTTNSNFVLLQGNYQLTKTRNHKKASQFRKISKDLKLPSIYGFLIDLANFSCSGQIPLDASVALRKLYEIRQLVKSNYGKVVSHFCTKQNSLRTDKKIKYVKFERIGHFAHFRLLWLKSLMCV